ncbi:MAG: alpha-amylase [Muribaculaceae bacterium]|nr:alpha-amylase [Muribaculaceae bacterium]
MKKILLLLPLVLLLVLVACDPKGKQPATFQLPDVPDVVMYQVNPRVFAPQQSLKAVTARLDSIAALGVNVIWVMPIYPIGEEKTKNSPYSIRDYKAIAPEFGTVDDLRQLIDSCHSRGIALILDWVANHTAWDNPWLAQHPDWYTHDSLGNIIYPPNTDWTDVADLNYDNTDLRQAMIDAMMYWVTQVGVDGFRCDVADMVPVDFWRNAIDTLRAAAKPRQLLMLAEGNRPDNFDAGFDMNYAWNFKGTLVKVFTEGAPATALVEADTAEYNGLPDGKVKLRFTTNHDNSTEVTPVAQFGPRGQMAAFVATTFLHGGALIYGSQEVAYPNPINFFHYVPVDWTANPDIYREYQRLIAIYNAESALRHGAPASFSTPDVLLFSKGNGVYLVAVNVRDRETDVTIPDVLRNRQRINLLDSTQVDTTARIHLAPYEYRIMKNK